MSLSQPEVIHLIFKTHLDIGFTDLARNVVARYFDDFIPRALATVEELRQRGGAERFRWTTGAWLISEGLDRAATAERDRLERAIVAGDLIWHGLPFTVHSELMDADLFTYGLSLSQELDRRFGRQTIAAKMTDVPGHTRAIVPLLAAAGIRFLHIGVNAASKSPDVPPVFVWHDPSGAEVLVMYQKGGYGGYVHVPGMRDALAFAHTDDNRGPQSAEQVLAAFQGLQRRFPAAQVIASTLDAYAERLLEVKDELPVVTGEIGDTWIHGVGSDPKKVSQFRELCRLRRQWLADGRARADERRIAAFSRALLLVPEHTWGLDEKTYLADRTTYARAAFDATRSTPPFRAIEESWAEQRAYVDAAVAALDTTPLAEQARTALRALEPQRPSTAGMEQRAAGHESIDNGRLAIGFDQETGAIIQLIDRATGRSWAAPDHPLALLRYQTFSQDDYERFRRQYNVNKRATTVWAVPDFTKPGIASAGAEARWWQPRLVKMYHAADVTGERVLLELAMPDVATTRFGCPHLATLQVHLPAGQPVVQLDLQWFEKPSSRLPEALWLSFSPCDVDPQGWMLEKLGQVISPLEAVRNGNRRLHAVGREVLYRHGQENLRIETLDAPLVAPGEPALLNFTNRQPALRHGMHFNLYNNIWGTNFPLWYGEDGRFRFVLRFGRSSEMTT